MYKSNMAENPEKQTAWKCRLDQYPPNNNQIETILAEIYNDIQHFRPKVVFKSN